MPIPLVLPVLAAAAAAVTARQKSARAAEAPPSSGGGSMPWQTFAALTGRWADVFKVPPVLLWAIATVETRRNPKRVNQSPRAAAKGGAWGLYQVTLDTAKDLMKRYGPQLAKFPEAARWDGSGPSLLDPGLNSMLGAFYLAGLWHEFGDFATAAGAYQSGPTAVRKVLASGGNVATGLGPQGREYVRRALVARQQLEPIAQAMTTSPAVPA